MPVSELKLIKRCVEFCGVDKIRLILTTLAEYTSFSIVAGRITRSDTMLFTSAWREG